MKKVFFVRHRSDKTPYLLVTVNPGGTDFQPLSDEADDVADVFDSVYKNRPISKQELDAALDDDFDIEGPINPTRGNLNLLQDFLADANQPLSPRKLAPSAKSFDISAVPLGFSDVEGKVNLTEYKARNFLYEQTKTTFNYEVKRVRAVWDPSLSIPGTGRRGGWRCPVGTRYGGQITDRFGRNCGWGVARRIANAITNIGERMESLDDRRRGRRVERRNRRMLERLGRAGGEGRAERGMRNVAEALDGGEATPTPDVAPAPKAPRKPGRGVQARRRARNTTEALADARDRGLRDSERRRVRREIEKPGAARSEQVGEQTKQNDLNKGEEAILRKLAERAVREGRNGQWDIDWDLSDDDKKNIDGLIEKGYLDPQSEMQNRPDGVGEERVVWWKITDKAKDFLGFKRDNSPFLVPKTDKDKDTKPQAPRKRPRNARKPAKRPQGEARQDPTKPVGGPNETEDYAGYVNRKYDEYAENVRKIRERGGRAGFLTRREWYDINKANLDDAWRKKGKGEAPDDFMPPTPAKKRRRQPGARKKPPVQDKEPDAEKPEANEPPADKPVKPKKPEKKKRAWTIDYGKRRPRNRMIAGAGRGENRNIAGNKELTLLTDDELIAELARINDDEFMKDWDIRPVEREAIKKNIEEEIKYRVDKLPGADALNDVLPPRGGDKPDKRPAAEINEEQAIKNAKFDADDRVDAIGALVAGGKLDTNQKAQLKRKYREVQDAQERAQKGIRDNVDEFLKNENFKDAEAYLADVENDAVKMIDDVKKQQERLSAIAQNENMADRVRQDALRGIAENAAYLDAARINARYAREQKENIAAAKDAAKPRNPAVDFRDVPFKVYAADATEPNKFMRNANDRGDARAELRLMVGEAARREIKKWEDGQRKKPKMMIMYHNGKAYVAEYDEFKKMTKAEQDEQIKKGIIVWDVNRGMSDNITRSTLEAREKLKQLFEADLEKGQLKPAVDDVVRKFPRVKVIAEGVGIDVFDENEAKRQLRKLRDDMNKDFKDFPDFRVVQVRDEDNNFVVVAIPDEDFRALDGDNLKFKKNATKIAQLDGKIAPTRPRKNQPKPQEPDAAENNPIGNPFLPKVDKRLDLGVKFEDKGIGEYKPIVNPQIKNEADAIKFVKEGGDLSKVPHEYWQSAVLANSSRDKVDATTRFRMLSKNGGAIGDTKIFVLRDEEGFGTNQGLVFKASDDNDNLGELVGWNLMHQMGIIKGGAVADGQNSKGNRYMILPFAFNDVPNGNELTAFGANAGEGNYPITEINANISPKHQPQMFAARLNQELLNYALGVADRHRGNGMAKAVKLPNGEHMAHIVPIDLGWAGRGVQGDPLLGGGVDDRFWRDLSKALQKANDTEKVRIRQAVIAAWDNAIDRIGATLEGGKEEFVRNAVKNLNNAVTRAKAEKLYDVLTKQRASLMRRRADLLAKIGA